MKHTPAVLVPLAEGFEEIEAITIVDVLRRAEIPVVTAGLAGRSVAGAHGVRVEADILLDEAKPEDFAMVALPGGLPGAHHLRDDPRVLRIARSIHQKGGWAAAICAAPVVLNAAGLTAGRRVTSYPGFGEGLDCRAYVEDRVVEDDRVLTSRGPGTALEFSYAIVELMAGRAKANALRKGMLAPA